MAFDDPIVFILIFLILVPILVIYATYKLAKFMYKVNKFIDEQTKRQKEGQAQPAS